MIQILSRENFVVVGVQEAYAKTQRIQQKLQSQESSAADVMPLDVESDVNSEEEV